MLETERTWDRLRAKYYQEWLDAEPGAWAAIKLKLEMITDLRLTLRKMANSEVDNAG